jgi:hypothetical protein
MPFVQDQYRARKLIETTIKKTIPNRIQKEHERQKQPSFTQHPNAELFLA